MQLHPLRVRRLAYQAATGGTQLNTPACSGVFGLALHGLSGARNTRVTGAFLFAEQRSVVCHHVLGHVSSASPSLSRSATKSAASDVLATALFYGAGLCSFTRTSTLSRHAPSKLQLSASLSEPRKLAAWCGR